MPHLLFLASGAAGLYCAYRWVRRETDRVETALKRAERRIKKRSASHPVTELAFDPASGIYRPAE